MAILSVGTVLFLLRGDRSSSGPLDGATRLTTHYRRNAPYNRHWWCIHSTRQSFGRQDVDTGCGFIFGTTSRSTSLTLCQTGWIEAEFFFDSCIFLLDLWQATSSCIAGPWWTACSYFFRRFAVTSSCIAGPLVVGVQLYLRLSPSNRSRLRILNLRRYGSVWSEFQAELQSQADQLRVRPFGGLFYLLQQWCLWPCWQWSLSNLRRTSEESLVQTMQPEIPFQAKR